MHRYAALLGLGLFIFSGFIISAPTVYAAPVVSITSPQQGEVVKNSTTITASATDPSGIARVDFYVDATPIGSATNAPYAVVWNTAGLATGSLHTIFATAVSTTGGSASISTQVIINNGKATDMHVFKFYIDPALVTDLGFAKSVLPKYVSDMNYVISKNTPHWFVFNPETDIVLATSTSGTAYTFPLHGFEVQASITKSTLSQSYDGSTNHSSTGAAILNNLKWLQIYDPDTLIPGTTATRDYWIQIDHMLHEFAHVCGAGMGEYYNLGTINDTTGVAPTLNMSVSNGADSYWKQHTDVFTDPLLWLAYGKGVIGNPTSRAALLNVVKYSPLTAAVMSGGYRIPNFRHPTVDFSNLKVRIMGTNQLPVQNANVKIWKVVGTPPYTSTLEYDLYTDAYGYVNFSWGVWYDPHNNYDFLKLVKVYAAGTTTAAYISVFETDEARLLQNKTTYERVLSLPIAGDGILNPPADTETPSIPQNISGSSVSTSQINLSWSASTDNVGVAGYSIYRDGVVIGTSSSPAYNDTALTENTTYTYRVSAYDAAGNSSAQSSQVSVTTLASADTQAPTVPQNVVGTAISTSQINLSWSASTDNVGVSGYRIYRNGALVGTSGTTAYSDTNLQAGTAYQYRVSAYDAAGNGSLQSSQISVSTQTPPDTTPPSVSITSPANGTKLKGNANAVVTASASDASGIALIVLKIDNTVVQSCNNTATCSYTWQGKTITSGNHTISATATDASSNANTSVASISVSK